LLNCKAKARSSVNELYRQYCEWGVSCASSVSSGKCHYFTLNYAKGISFYSSLSLLTANNRCI